MIRTILISLLPFCFITNSIIAQNGDFRSIASGNWTTPATWERDADQNGIFEESPSTVSPNFNDGSIIIQSGDNVIIDVDLTIDETIVETGGTLTISPQPFTSPTICTVNDGAGVDLIVNGTIDLTDDFAVFGSILSSNGSLQANTGGNITISGAGFSTISFNGGSTYIHNRVGGTIPSSTWSSNSTLSLESISSSADLPSGLNQTFGNFTFNSPSATGLIDLALTSSTVIGGELLFSNTGTATVVINNSSSQVLSIGSIGTSGTSRAGITIGQIMTINLSQGINHNSSVFFITSSFGGNTTINVAGDIINNSTISNLSTGTTTYNFNGGVAQELLGTGTFPNTTGIINIDLTGSNTVLDLNIGTIGSGSGTLTVNSGTSLQFESNVTDPISSQIGVSSFDFNSGSTVIYAGTTSSQQIGLSHPSTLGVDVSIQNNSGISLASDITFGGDLTLVGDNSGADLSIGGNILILEGSISSNNNNIITTSSSNLILNGDINYGIFPFPAGSQEIGDFTLDANGGGVTFGNEVTINGDVTLTNGNLIFDDQTLTIGGSSTSFSFTNGGLSGNQNSTLIINGSGSLGSISFDNSGNTISTLTMNRTSGTATVEGSLTIDNLNLQNGNLTNNAVLSISDGGTVIRDALGSLSGSSLTNSISETYNIIYDGAVTTGVEMPDNENDLGDLTINSNLTLDQEVFVNGNLNLNSGILSLGSFDLTMNGATWNDNGGVQTGTGQVIFNSSTAISESISVIDFSNISVTASSTLTFPSGDVEVSGNISFAAGSTVNNGSGKIDLNGSSNQTISAGGTTLNDITVNKTGGNVILTSQLNIIGALEILTSTEFNSSGNLVLISSSDGTSGNASIKTLPAGASVSGDVTVQRFVSGEGRIFRYITPQVSGETVSGWQDDFPITGTFEDPSSGMVNGTPIVSSNPSLFFYDESVAGGVDLGFIDYPSTGFAAANPLEVGRGYAAFIREGVSSTTIDVTGPVNQGVYDYVALGLVTNTDNVADPDVDDGWNLVGNPYPSSVDWDDIGTASGSSRVGIDNTVQVSDNSSGFLVYRAWNGLTGDLTNGLIAQGQAFWVRAITSTPSFTLSENVKVESTATFLETEPLEQIKIELSDGSFSDAVFIHSHQEATDGFDLGKDGLKRTNFLNNEPYLNISVLGSDDIRMKINAVEDFSCGKSFRIEVKDLIEGNYTLNFLDFESIPVESDILLIDDFLNITYNLSETSFISFEVTPDTLSQGANRFILKFPQIDINETVSVSAEDICAGDQANVIIQNSQQGIIYQLYDTESLVVQEEGNGEELNLVVSDNFLQDGNNSYALLAGHLSCDDFMVIEDSVEILVVEINEVMDVSGTSVCKGDTAIVLVQGADALSTYALYDSPTGNDPILESLSGEFKISTNSDTIVYVDIINKAGCVSEERVNVEIKVTELPELPAITIDNKTLVSNYETGNQWFFNGDLLQGETSSTLSFSEPGVYGLEVTDGLCLSFTSIEIVITGIESDNKRDREIFVFPNPVRSLLTIRFDDINPVEGNVSFTIRDISGNGAIENLKFSNKSDFLEVDVSALRKGIYVVRMEIGEEVYYSRFLKQ